MIAEAEDRSDGGLLAAREKIKTVLIAPCVKQKRIIRGGFPLRFDAMPQCDGAELAQCWLDCTSEAPARFRAENLYAGAGWRETLAAFREAGGPEKADLFILSAGFGLVHYAEELPSYTATFSKDACRIAQFITSSATPFAVRHREWWRAINQARLANSSPLAALAPQYPHARFWVAASQGYLAAARDDLDVLAVACGPEKLFLVSIGARPCDLTPALKACLLPVDLQVERLLPGLRTAINPRSLAWLLEKIAPEGEFSREELCQSITTALAVALPPSPRTERTRISDAEVLDWIAAQRRSGPAACSVLLRRLRDAGQACEASRFSRLYHTITAQSV